MTHKIKELRKAREWSQAKLGDLIGLSAQQIGLLENGKRPVKMKWAIELAKVLAKNGEWLDPIDFLDERRKKIALAFRSNERPDTLNAPLLFEVIEYVLDLFAQIDGVTDPAKAAEVIMLVYAEMAEAETLAPHPTEGTQRRQHLIDVTDNVLRLTHRQERMHHLKQEAQNERSETKPS